VPWERFAELSAEPAQAAEVRGFSASTGGAKMHVIYDEGEGQPIYAAVSTVNVNDITVAQSMPLQPGATDVFDLGYYDFAWWAKREATQCRIVTRLKRNTPLAVIKTRPLSASQAQRRREPMAGAVREVVVRLEQTPNTVLRILSNDLDAPVEEIAALYNRNGGA
jgi:Transposase DDE domain